MVVFNYSGGEINTKIVYYGPGLSGKTTNLEYIYSKMPLQIKGKMISMKTRTDRTLFFDFLPLDLGDISGFKLRFLLYTVPGQVYYNATRKLVLKGADAVIFVADSAPDKIQENIESLKNLETNLNEHDLSLDTIPWVIQYNKRDLEDAMPVAELDKALNVLHVPSFEAIASQGGGVYETFQKISSMLYYQVKQKLDRDERESEELQAKDIPIESVPEEEISEDQGVDLSTVVDAALREVDDSIEPITVEACGAVADSQTECEEDHELSAACEAMTDSCLEHDDDSVTYDPPGIASRSMPPSDPDTDEFKFASLKELKINGEVGQVVDLEERGVPESIETSPGELVTDPCGSSGPAPPQEQAESVPMPQTAVETKPERVSDEEVIVKVPVRISSEHDRKNLPVKLILELQFSEE